MAALAQAWPDGLGCLPQRAAEILAAARRSAAAGGQAEADWALRLAGVTSREAAAAASELAAAEASAEASAARQARRDRWHAWVGAELKGGGGVSSSGSVPPPIRAPRSSPIRLGGAGSCGGAGG